MPKIRFAALAILFPVAAFADLTGTATLTPGTSLNLETGATAASGGDLLWNGTTLAPQGKAEALNLTTALGLSGTIEFSTISLSLFQTYQSIGFLTPTGLAIGSLSMGTIVAAITNGPHDAVLIVTGISGSSISLQYVTFGVTPPSVTPPPPVTTGPSITQVQNNYSYILPGLPNYGIAPGALFIIVGTNLASATTPVVQSAGGNGIPASLNGATIAVTVNGVTTHPGIYYAIATQIAAVLPSSTPVGTGTITVTYNGTTSAAAPITVLQSALGFDTYTGSGSGLGVATDPVTGSLFFYNQSAKPGQTIVLWGSGLGANPADSDTVATATPHAGECSIEDLYRRSPGADSLSGRFGIPGRESDQRRHPAVGAARLRGRRDCRQRNDQQQYDDLAHRSFRRVLQRSLPQIHRTGDRSRNQHVRHELHGRGPGDQPVGRRKRRGRPVFDVARHRGHALCGVQPFLRGIARRVRHQLREEHPGSHDPHPGRPNLGTLTISGPGGTAPATSFPAADGGPSGVYATTPLAPSFIPPTGGTFTFHATGSRDIGPFTVSVSSPSLMQWTNPSAYVATIARSQALTLYLDRRTSWPASSRSKAR